ncbi:group II intron reverse transcriptase/maturase [Bradyrhizobium sp. 187]|uniref:group II intron reverse transcriptase/maturase n=1 Tax=Bradyrhizobium sp. 187 TaxID=2782655 RepID=UPI001FFF2F22|nr:group II intron reverse transcriptase/maturase [Bradyrhizobium sp. 187]
MPPNLERVNAAAKQAAQTRFTALLHHVDEDALLRAFRRQKRQASAGVDGVTVAKYEQRLTDNLRELCGRVHTGRYRPQPVRRVYIPKADGGKRPLGVPALEDKIVQSAVAEVLSAVYEVDFLGFSYGFRPGRNPHMALDALHTAIMSQRVNWVLDADIRNFFDAVDHEWLLRMVAHRIADPRILRLIELWLRAGVLESGEKDRDTPQGAGVSPLLANIFLHYILDLWIHQWGRRRARGRVVAVRYADDFVRGFESRADAQEMLLALKARLASFGLMLHEDKTRLIEFGRFAALSRQRRGERRPETFAFLGFTHYCGWTRDGRFIVKHKTEGKRLTRKLTALRHEAWRLMHAPMAKQREWFAAVLRGHYGSTAGRTIIQRSTACREVRRTWMRCLRRRSQKSRRMGWSEFETLTARFCLPVPRITRTWAQARI